MNTGTPRLSTAPPCWQAFALREVSAEDVEHMLTVADSATLTESNITGAVLAIPKVFFYNEKDENAPICWGYVVKVGQKVKRTDSPAYSVKCHDGTATFYLGSHPGFKEEEKERYFQNPNVKVLCLS